MNTNLNIGWAEIDITPDKNISLRGQFYERISQYVETPITVTAMALEADGDAMVICSCDLVAVEEALLRRVRSLLDGKTDLPLDKIILHATHTHTSFRYAEPQDAEAGPDEQVPSLAVLRQFVSDDMLYAPTVTVDDSIMSEEAAFDFLAERIALAVKTAWEARRPAVYACGFGRAAVGMNRRACYDDGSAQMWGDTNTPNFTHLEGGCDNGVEMLFTFDPEKRLTGVILNVACPAQVLEHRSFVSSDYWGKVKLRLREQFGDELFILGLCSPAGDQCPRDLIRWQNGETPVFDPNISRPNPIERRSDGSMFDVQGTVRIGRRIASEVLAAYEEIDEYFGEVTFAHKVETLKLPLRRVTLAEYQAAKAEIERFVEKNKGRTIDYTDTAAMHVHAGIISRFAYQQNHDLVPIELHCIRLGDIALATNPFELFLDYGNRIRARSKAKQTFLVQLACGDFGYLPTARAEAGSHYSAYVSSGNVGHIGGDLLVRETLNEINAMWD